MCFFGSCCRGGGGGGRCRHLIKKNKAGFSEDIKTPSSRRKPEDLSGAKGWLGTVGVVGFPLRTGWLRLGWV